MPLYIEYKKDFFVSLDKTKAFEALIPLFDTIELFLNEIRVDNSAHFRRLVCETREDFKLTSFFSTYPFNTYYNPTSLFTKDDILQQSLMRKHYEICTQIAVLEIDNKVCIKLSTVSSRNIRILDIGLCHQEFSQLSQAISQFLI